MSDQYEHFSTAHEYMKTDLGRQAANRMLESALFLISGGTNDMLDNYYALPIRKLMYSVSAYHDFLLKNLATFVKKLYMKHARRVGVLGLPPVGCLPVDIASSSRLKRECVSSHNADAQLYNDKLKQLLKKLANDLPDLKITYVDIYNPLMDMINNPAKYGFEHTLEGCCGSGSWELGPLCSQYAEVCSDASKYIFWDAAHPTQAAYEKLTKILKDNSLSTLLN
ncbi:GDSL esterase/lipase At2g40250-like [Salvia miltiorrhiza]|uniref:GDSL esterase/lipase At2g40250-like n=1 Tax=Salvia miltiorrhiza TaxID=226208 RepID=UPI0025AD7D1E|nr:GDSL esterase/lipase At2g40250-like [Salvia miltiorrhiza]